MVGLYHKAKRELALAQIERDALEDEGDAEEAGIEKWGPAPTHFDMDGMLEKAPISSPDTKTPDVEKVPEGSTGYHLDRTDCTVSEN